VGHHTEAFVGIDTSNLRIAKRYTSQQMHSGKRLGRTNSRFLRLRQALATRSAVPDPGFASVALGRGGRRRQLAGIALHDSRDSRR
jgi:hypothetical protein